MQLIKHKIEIYMSNEFKYLGEHDTFFTRSEISDRLWQVVEKRMDLDFWNLLDCTGWLLEV